MLMRKQSLKKWKKRSSAGFGRFFLKKSCGSLKIIVVFERLCLAFAFNHRNNEITASLERIAFKIVYLQNNQ
jgi:hypothetical protein